MLDFHTHSTASDGTCRPDGIVRLAAHLNLTALALTDHDTTEGLPEFLDTAKQIGFTRAIPGIEFSCHIEKSFNCHIIGLGINPDTPKLQEDCKFIRKKRNERNIAMIGKLRKAGLDITIEDVLAERETVTDDCVVARPHIANALVRKGYAKNCKDAFKRWITYGRPGYLSRERLNAADTFTTIHQAGGLAIWAHPFSQKSSLTNAQLERYLAQLVKAGLDGLEAYYPDHTPAQTQTLLRLAQQFNLLVSGGTDFHGETHENINLATGNGTFAVPDSILPPLLDALARKP